jgi:hypothetical protein
VSFAIMGMVPKTLPLMTSVSPARSTALTSINSELSAE